MQGDDGEDSSSGRSRTGNQQSRGVSADDCDCLERGGAQGLIAAPFASQRYGANDQYRKGKCYQQHPQSNVRARSVPIHDALRGASRFVLLRLYISRKERSHEENSRENEKQFQGGEGTLNRLHGFTLYHKVYFSTTKTSN